jgi:branched-chain amino acid transport system substrate-binding protein
MRFLINYTLGNSHVPQARGSLGEGRGGVSVRGRWFLSFANGLARARAGLVAVALAVAIGACGGSGAAQPQAGGTVTFGGLCDLSGRLAVYGSQCNDALQLAVKDVNNTGGFVVGGKKYTLAVDIQDSKSDPTAAVAAAQTLVRDKGYKVLFGTDTDGGALQVVGATKGTGVLQFSGGGSIQSLANTPGYETLFGVLLPNAFWIGNLSRALTELNISSGLVVFVYPDDSSGNTVVPIEENFVKSKGYTTQHFMFPTDTTDFRSVMTKVKALHPAAVVSGYSATYTLPVAQATVDLEAAPALIAVGATPDQVPLKIAKQTGKPFPIPWVTLQAERILEYPTSAGMTKLRDSYVKGTGKDPVGQETLIWWYDPVHMVVKAMEQAGTTTDTKAITKKLEVMHYNGALQDVHYTANHLPVYGVDMGVLVSGNLRWVTLSPPAGT